MSTSEWLQKKKLRVFEAHIQSLHLKVEQTFFVMLSVVQSRLICRNGSNTKSVEFLLVASCGKNTLDNCSLP